MRPQHGQIELGWRADAQDEGIDGGCQTVGDFDGDDRVAGLPCAGCDRDGSARAAAADDDAGIGDQRLIAGGGDHGETIDRRLSIADGKADRRGGRVGGGILIGNIGNGRRGIVGLAAGDRSADF